eukprot:gb/GFBE01031112.1/.p1 GENE.gb/GFBE01031112.1/~~gb/GFBE01031112.1/.p1  ORF type:complete len:522 (+),score=89.25 gb/GFBE01031112.1/:1-1566(+)
MLNQPPRLQVEEDAGPPSGELPTPGLVPGVVMNVAGVVRGAAETAAGVASAAKDRLAPSASSALDVTAGAANYGGGLVTAAAGVAGRGAMQAAGIVAEGVIDQAVVQKQRLENLKDHFADLLEGYIKRKVQRLLVALVSRLPGIIKSATDDTEMPQSVKKAKDGLIDCVWPDVRQELTWELAVLLDGVADEEVLEDDPGCIGPRAWLRYHLYPYNKGFWGNLRDPVWIIFTLISLVPAYGVSPAIFLFLFLIIDKTDEFQLLCFILQFKGMQFITQGFLRSFLGFFQYLSCATAPGNDSDHFCETRGPGSTMPMAIVLVGYVLQIVLVWIAFILLPCSKAKGRTQLTGHLDAHKSLDVVEGHTRGGYLSYLLWYDLFCFLLSAAGLAYAMYLRNWVYDDWPVKHAFFAIQMIYGYLSMPFFLFLIPLLRNVLTHSVPTGYDECGRVRKYKGPPRPPHDESKSSGRLLSLSILRKDEAFGVLEKLKTLITGGRVDSLDADEKDAESGIQLGPQTIGKLKSSE